MDFQTLTLELQKRTLDLAQVKHPKERYEAALNFAVSQYPLCLWQLTIDGTTLDTVADQCEYVLSGVSGLSRAEQLCRVWIDDSEGIKRETGRWALHDNAGTLTLILDEVPSDAYDITLEFRAIPPQMSDPTDTTSVDDEWLLARALITILSEADWGAEDPQELATRMEAATNLLVVREQQLRAQRSRPSRRSRTTAWRQYVT